MNDNPEIRSAEHLADVPPPPPPSSPEASYFEKLLLMIPSDMVAGYFALDGVMKQSTPDITLFIYWTVFGSMLILTPLYIWFKPTENALLKCSRSFRVYTGTISFAVWVFALGGPFSATFDWYRPVYGSLLLVTTTLAIPVFEKIAAKYSI